MKTLIYCRRGLRDFEEIDVPAIRRAINREGLDATDYCIRDAWREFSEDRYAMGWHSVTEYALREFLGCMREYLCEEKGDQ